MANRLAKVVMVVVGFLSFTLIACGGVASAPEGTATPLTQPDGPIQEVASTEQNDASGGTIKTPASSLESNTDSVLSNETPTDQSPGVDDARVEALVAEWESDLTPIKSVSECVEQALGLNRPLLPEDLQLQANQPAIVTCLKAEVGNE